MSLDPAITGLLGLMLLVSLRGAWLSWKKSSRWPSRLLAVAFGCLALLTALSLALGWRLEFARGSSMLPTLGRTNVFWVKHQRFASDDLPARGSVVLFESPVPQEGKRLNLAKRVIGLPGDRVVYRRGELSVNGQAVVTHWSAASLSRFQQPGPLWEGGAEINRHRFSVLSDHGAHFPIGVDIVVPQGHCFVMGDNWGNSLDSRDVGAIPAERIHGTLLLAWGEEASWTRP